MSGKSKRKDTENYASDGDSDGQAPPKKSAKVDDEEGIVVCEVLFGLWIFFILFYEVYVVNFDFNSLCLN